MTAMELDSTQQTAVDSCVNVMNRVAAVTGSAGTGKTTILQTVYRQLADRYGEHDVVLCAPTGKAAKRITEATGIEAMTIHRLLEYPMPGEIDETTGKALSSSDPKRCRRRPLDQHYILCDEYAMVNVEVHRNLLDAIPHGGCIRMFGDANQLQPIEQNKRLAKEDSSFLKMLDKHPSTRLTTIHRQAEDSSIIAAGAKIVVGNMPTRSEDFNLKITSKPVDAVLDFVTDQLHEGVDYGSLDNQIITPTRVGWVGSDALNGAVQSMLQPATQKNTYLERNKWVDNQRFLVYVGDKVLCTKNNYGLEVFNGETGIILEITNTDSIVVDFGDKTTEIPISQAVEGRGGEVYYINPQKDIDLAYLITTHKSQGSEYERVLYVMNSSRAYLLNRKNFYTGISRARKQVTVMTDQKGLTLSLTKRGDN
jgi:exodeoxyribonuclease V alpha subunit